MMDQFFSDLGIPKITAFKSARRDGKSFIHMVNHFSNDLGIPEISPYRYF